MYYLTKCLSDTEYEIVSRDSGETAVVTDDFIVSIIKRGNEIQGVTLFADNTFVGVPYTKQALMELNAALETACPTCCVLIDKANYTVKVSGFGEWQHFNGVTVVNGENRIQKGRGVLRTTTVSKLSGILKQIYTATNVGFDYKILPDDVLLFYAF